MKQVRQESSGRFFLGRNKVMAKALGETVESEYKEGLAQLTEHLSGNVGLLFTNEPLDQVKEYCCLMQAFCPSCCEGLCSRRWHCHRYNCNQQGAVK